MRMIIALIGSCIAVYMLFVTWLYINQRNMMYHPEKETHAIEHYKLKNTDEIRLTTDDGIDLQVWYHKPANNEPMTIFLHGNAGNLEDRVDKLKQLIEMGYGFIIPAWRGFGKSKGSPTMQGLYLDAEAVVDFVKKRGYKLSNTIMIGESLGTGIATEMATRYKFKGLFLITPYKSIAERAEELYPAMALKWLTKDNFNVIDKISAINQPVLIIHGTSDKVVPYSHAVSIFNRAQEPKKFITYPNIGHSNYDVKDIFTQMREFF